MFDVAHVLSATFPPTFSESIMEIMKDRPFMFAPLAEHEGRLAQMCRILMKTPPQTSQYASIYQAMMNHQKAEDSGPALVSFCPPWMCSEDEELES